MILYIYLLKQVAYYNTYLYYTFYYMQFLAVTNGGFMLLIHYLFVSEYSYNIVSKLFGIFILFMGLPTNKYCSL